MRHRSITVLLAVVSLGGGAMWAFLESRDGETRVRPPATSSTQERVELDHALPAEPAVAAERVAIAPIEVADAGSLRVRVVSCDGAAVPGCGIQVVSHPGGPDDVASAVVLTDEQGIVSVDRPDSGADLGEAWLIAEKLGWRSEALPLERRRRSEDPTITIELHRGRPIVFDVRSARDAPIADAEVIVRTWRERPPRAAEKLGAHVAMANSRVPLARTDANGRVTVWGCSSELLLVEAVADGFAPKIAEVHERGAGEEMLQLRLDALLAAAIETPKDRAGKPIGSCGHLSFSVVDGNSRFRPLPQITVDRARAEVHRRLQDPTLQVQLDIEADPSAYPPKVAFEYVPAPGAPKLVGEVVLRHVWDVRSEDVIRCPPSYSCLDLGIVTVRFPGITRASDLPRNYWGLVSDGHPAAWRTSSGLPEMDRFQDDGGRFCFRFRVVAGKHFVACRELGIEPVQFAAVPIEVRPGSEQVVDIADYAPVSHSRIRVVGQAIDGRRIDDFFVKFHEVLRRTDGSNEEFEIGRDIGFQTRSYDGWFELPFGEYYVTAAAAEGAYLATPLFVMVDREAGELTLSFKEKAAATRGG